MKAKTGEGLFLLRVNIEIGLSLSHSKLIVLQIIIALTSSLSGFLVGSFYPEWIANDFTIFIFASLGFPCRIVWKWCSLLLHISQVAPFA